MVVEEKKGVAVVSSCPLSATGSKGESCPATASLEFNLMRDESARPKRGRDHSSPNRGSQRAKIDQGRYLPCMFCQVPLRYLKPCAIPCVLPSGCKEVGKIKLKLTSEVHPERPNAKHLPSIGPAHNQRPSFT